MQGNPAYNKMGINSYQNIQKESMSGRETEARVLSTAALKLKKCQESWGSKNHRTKLEEAFEYNHQIWSIFQAELTKPDHPMYKELRQNILNLSVFIEGRIYETRAYPAPEKLTAIININNSLAAGLRASPATVQ
jgi:flagellar biosynthesis activator protein FlaF